MKTKKKGSQFIKISSVVFVVSLIVATIIIFLELQNLSGDAAGKGMAFIIIPMIYIPFSIVAVILSIIYYRIIKKKKAATKKIKIIALLPIFPFLIFVLSLFAAYLTKITMPDPLTTIDVQIKSSRLFKNGRYSTKSTSGKGFGKIDTSNNNKEHHIYKIRYSYEMGKNSVGISDNAIKASITFNLPDTHKPFPYTEWENMKVNNDTVTVQLRYKGIIVKY